MILYFVILIMVVFLLLLALMASDFHFHKKPDGKRIRVSCVGDSITNGALIPNRFRDSYPSQLQRLLGKGYHVENFGLNDRTLQYSGHKPYSREKEYGQSLSFDPDIVVVLLGTNDTKPSNWVSEERFMEEYESFLKQYLSAKSAPRVILCAPPWAIPASNRFYAITNDVVPCNLPKVANAVRKLGERMSLPVVDLFSNFDGKLELISYDGLHPNKAGARCIAENVFREILMGTIKISQAASRPEKNDNTDIEVQL